MSTSGGNAKQVELHLFRQQFNNSKFNILFLILSQAVIVFSGLNCFCMKANRQRITTETNLQISGLKFLHWSVYSNSRDHCVKSQKCRTFVANKNRDTEKSGYRAALDWYNDTSFYLLNIRLKLYVFAVIRSIWLIWGGGGGAEIYHRFALTSPLFEFIIY